MAEKPNQPEAVVAVAVTEEKPAAKDQASNPRNAMVCWVFQVKHIAGFLSILSFVLSLPILASAIWLFFMKDYECEEILRLPRLQLGVGIGLLAVFTISNLVLFMRPRLPMVGVLLVMVPLIVMLTMGLTFVGAYKMQSRMIPASPMWLKRKVLDNIYWNDIKSCIFDTGTCQDMATTCLELKSYDFSIKKLSSLEYGCCRPPKICDMIYVNATFWVKDDQAMNNSSYPYDSDCDLWKNDRHSLCYDCQSCRQGYLKTLESKWWKLGMFLVVMAVLLTFSHLSLFLATMWELVAAKE